MSKSYVNYGMDYRKDKRDIQEARYKKYRERWYKNPVEDIVGEFPIHLDIETSSVCNLKCKMCYQSMFPTAHKFMEESLYQNILKQAEEFQLESMKFQYRGEPLADKRVPKWVKMAKDIGVIDTMMNTNATLLTEDMSRQLIESGLNQLLISFDGIDKDLYEEYRVGAKFEKTIENVKRFREIRDEMGSKTPYLTVKSVKLPNLDIDKYVKFWEPIADRVGFGELLDFSGEFTDDRLLKDYRCAQLWQRLVILVDGDVMPCCHSTHGWKKELVLGNAYNTSLTNIWNNAKMTVLRDLHKKGLSHLCDMCTHCGLRKSVPEQK